MANAKLPKVAQYVRNVGKSIAFASINAIADNAEGIKDFIEDNEEVFTSIYSSVKNYRQTLKNIDRAIRQNNLFKAIEYGSKNMMEDIKTGNFYKDRTYDNAESIIGLDDDGLDFSYEIYGSDDTDSGSNNYSSEKYLSNSFSEAIGAAATGASSVVAKGTDMVIRSTKASTTILSSQIERSTATLHSGLGAVYNSINQMNSFLNGPMMAHLENSRTYFDNSLRIMQDQQAMIKELLEMQRNLYKREEQGYRTSKLDQSMSYDGSANLKGYLKNVEINIRNVLDQSGIGMFAGDTGMNIPMVYAAAPFKMMLDMMADAMMPKKFKKNLKSFDNGVTSIFSQLISKINFTKKDIFSSDFMEFISGIFGIDIENKKSINTANYNRGAVPFDGITKKSIVEVIPGYLARIEAALTGRDERYFDPHKGVWKSAKEIERDFNEEKSSAILSANRGITTDTYPLLNKLSTKEAKDMEKKIQGAMVKIFEDGGYFNPSFKNGTRESSGNIWRDYGFSNKEQFDLFLSYLSDETIRGLASNNMRARQSYSRSLEEHERIGGAYNILYNGTFDETGRGKTDKQAVSGFGNVARNNILTLGKDEYGNNIFYYLREILSSIGRRNGGYKPPNGPDRNAPYNNGPSGTNRESETSSDESEDDSGFEDDDSWARAADKIKEEERKKREENAKKTAATSWIKNTLEKSPIGRFFVKAANGVGDLLSKPMKYATELLEKADKNLFHMMFGRMTDKDNNEITNIFEYIINQIKNTFENLGKWIKDKLKKILDPLWEKIKPKVDKYAKPVVEEMFNMGRSAVNRVKRGLSNTFGQTMNLLPENIAEKLRNGGVASADEIENSTPIQDSDGFDYYGSIIDSARGRIVTKRGLTMISPGEIIIPTSFNKKDQNKMLALEKRDRNRIAKAIGLNAKGTVDTEAFKKKLSDIWNENKDQKKAAKVGAGGILGAGAGILTGVNPLLGALAGAGISILNNSETLQKAIFGEEVDGEHKGGIIPDKMYKFFKKALPDIGDFGITGGVLGLFTPFGPLGGAAIGAGIGMLKNSESFKKFIFGDKASGEEGLMKKETYEKFKGFVKKAAPNMLIGAGAGILAGPFGLLGNAAMGAGLGLISSTDEFHNFLFGNKKEGTAGVLDALKTGLLDPAKEKFIEFAAEFKEYAKRNIIEPMKDFWKPVNQMLKNVIKNTAEFIADKMNDMFERTLGLPMHDFLQEKIFKPVGNIIFELVKAPIAVGKAIVAAPFRALGGISNTIRASQIRRGTAYDMTASERLAWRDQHSIRFNKFNGWRDRTRQEDEILMGMDLGQLQDVYDNAKSGLSSYAKLQKEAGKARTAVGQDISGFFNTESDDGKNRFSRVNYKTVNELTKLAQTGSIDQVNEFIDNMKGLSDKEKEELKNRIAIKVEAANRANSVMEKAKLSSDQMDDEMTKLIGRKFNGRKDRRQLYRSAEAELKARRRASEREKESPEVNATNNFVELYKDKTESIINQLITANEYLKHLVDPNASKNDTTPPGDKKDKNKKAVNGSSDTTATNQESTSIDLADPIKAKTKKKSFFANIWDQVTGRFITSNPDAKENVENEKERLRLESEDRKNRQANEKSNSILTKIKEGLLGNKNDKEDGGLLGKIFSKFGSVAKFLGITGLSLTGVSLFGHATEWFKTSVWPKMKEGLFGSETSKDDGLVGKFKTAFGTLLTGEDGKSGVLGWLKEKCFDPISGFFDRVKTLWEENGGLSGIIGKVLLPKLVSGWGLTMNNVVTPLVALLIKHAPSMLASLAKAIWNGVTTAIFPDNKKINRDGTTINADPALNEYKELASKNSNKFIAGLDNAVISLFDTSNSAYTSTGGTKVEFNTNTSSSGKYTYTGSPINKSSNDIMYTKAPGLAGLFGAKQSTNQIYYDENGNIAIDAYDTWNTTNSVASKITDVTGKGFIRGLAGAKPVTALANLMSKASAKGVGKGVTKLGTGILGSITKAAGKTISTGANLGSTINSLMNQGLLTNITDNASINFAKTISDAGGGSVDEILKMVSENGITDTAKNIFKNSTDDAVKHAALQGGRNANIAIKNANKLYNVSSNAATNIADDVVEATAKSADNIISKGINAVKNAADNTADNITSKIVGIFANLADSKIFNSLMEACSAGTTKKMLNEALEKIAKKIGDNLIGKVTKKALGSVVKVLGKFSPVTIVFWITDFIYGYNNADTILGIAKGDEYKIGLGQKCLCGLLNMINNQLTLGLIPTDLIVDIIVEYLFPLFGLDTESLNAARERADNILDQWNAANPENTYSNLEDFNNKDKITTKIKNSISAGWENVKTGATSAYNKVKEGITSVLNTGRKAISQFVDDPSSGVKDAMSVLMDGINKVIKSTFSGDFTGAMKVKPDVEENDAIGNVASTVFNVVKSSLTPVIFIGSMIGKVKNSVTGFIDSAKKIIPTVSTAITKKISSAWNPDDSNVEIKLQSTGNETLDNIANVVYNIANVLTTPSQLVGKGVNVVKDGILSLLNKYTAAINTKKTDDDKIKRAKDGDLDVFSNEYWTNANHDGEGFFGTLVNIQTYIEKVLNAPIIMINNIIGSISNSFKELQNWFGDKFGSIWDWVSGFFSGENRNESTNLAKSSISGAIGGAFGRGRQYGLGHMYQSNEAISNMRYGDSTIGESGCAPVAAANLLNSIGYNGGNRNVAEAARYAEQHNLTVPGGGTNVRYFNSYLGSKGIDTTNTSSKSTVMNALRNGNQVIMLGRDTNNHPGAPFGTTPHYVTATGISNNGNIIAEDPDLPQSYVEYRPNDIMGSMITSVIAETSTGRKKNLSSGRNRSNTITVRRNRPSSIIKRAINYGRGTRLGPQAIINVAKTQIGISENPHNSNNVKFNHAYYGNTTQTAQWCCIFVWWVFNQAGASSLFYGGKKTATCKVLMKYYKDTNHLDMKPRVGDIVFFNFDGGSVAQHVGIVTGFNSDNSIIYTIEGNTGSNNADGGSVMARERKIKSILGFAHPNYPYQYDASSVVDVSKWGDNNDYEAIAKNGGSVDSSYNTTYTDSTTTSSGNTLISALTDLGQKAVKALFGYDSYNALFGTIDSSTISDESIGSTNSDPITTTTAKFDQSATGKKIWEYLRNSGYTKAGTAGIMGNLYAESSLNPSNIQGSYEKKLGDDATYTNKINNKSYSKSAFTNDKAGYGLAQWTYDTRKKKLYEHTIEKGKAINDLEAQLGYLVYELGSDYRKLNSMLKATDSINDASDAVLEQFEKPKTLRHADRRKYSQKMMNTYGKGRAVTYRTGTATRALNNVGGSASRSIQTSSNYITTSSTPMVDYNTFLQTIITILLNISDNTAVLSKILDLLSAKFSIDIDKDEVSAAVSKSRVQAEKKLNDIISRNTSNSDYSKIINNKDTAYLLNAMRAIAAE